MVPVVAYMYILVADKYILLGYEPLIVYNTHYYVHSTSALYLGSNCGVE